MSGVVREATFDRDRSEIRITYQSGTTYAYRVAPRMWADFQKAESKGAWIGKNLRDRKYRKLP